MMRQGLTTQVRGRQAAAIIVLASARRRGRRGGRLVVRTRVAGAPGADRAHFRGWRPGVCACRLTELAGTDTPAIDALAADGVVFERAYAHSPQMLPAHASILSGQLPSSMASATTPVSR